MNIGIDVSGGDFAPKSILKGIIEALKVISEETKLTLIGKEEEIKKGLKIKSEKITVVHAPDVIEMGEHPTKAYSQKPKSSINIGFQLLKSGEIDAFCSAGNTGAMMVGSLFSIKAIEGIQRPAIIGFVPQISGKNAVMLDIGANADCKPEVLEQFAFLGSLYAHHTLKIENPRVGLLNIGEEEQKGSLLSQATYPLLKNSSKINFIGNVEGSGIFTDKADVIVCDGFVGNIIIKLGESFYDIFSQRKVKDSLVEKMNYEIVGGSPIIGVNGNVIIGHGKSSPTAIKNMILLAQGQIQSRIVSKIIQAYK